ncbi:hypothetical protein [Duganella sp. FT27W]|uniref:hypothetical protein n=1 Tax=Duganella sp. FT27W TaxID=2654636 RepID=UPI00128CB044|nr:hypothetical protein [Duganella sp. FT27W]MPQ56254.1 hypothetical protein [Duganella sp. FT27W]
MSTMNFKWGRDERGMEGWVAEGYANFDVTMPGQFAHDVLEHLPRGLKHGQIADELMALGARLYARVKSEWWWSQGFRVGVPETWGMELVTLLTDIRAAGLSEPALIVEPLLNDDMDDEIEAALEYGALKANREFEYQASWDKSLQGQASYDAQSELFQNMAAWMRRGYRACVARFKDRRPADIMWLGELMDQEAKMYDRGEEGDKLSVRVHEKDMEFEFVHKPGQFSEYYN